MVEPDLDRIADEILVTDMQFVEDLLNSVMNPWVELAPDKREELKIAVLKVLRTGKYKANVDAGYC